MFTRLILKLPWFVSAPSLVAGAVLLAAGLNLVAGPYFKRTFRDDIDPLAGLAAPAASGAPGGGGAAAPAAGGAAQPSAAAGAAGPAVLAQGELRDGDPGHHGAGRARLIRGVDGALTLRFENFSVTNGPDLFVILSTDPAGSRGSATDADALNLGRLKATDGNVNYAVPAGADTAEYRSVIIYCRAFKVVFAVATLEAAQ